jgi:hypothetical protein
LPKAVQPSSWIDLLHVGHLPKLLCTTLVALLPILAWTDGSVSMLGSADMDRPSVVGGCSEPPLFSLVRLPLLLLLTALSGLREAALPFVLVDEEEEELDLELDWTEMDLMGEALLGLSRAGRVAELAGPVRAVDVMLMPRQVLILGFGDEDLALVTLGLGANLMEAVAVLCGLMEAVLRGEAATGSGVSSLRYSEEALSDEYVRSRHTLFSSGGGVETSRRNSPPPSVPKWKTSSSVSPSGELSILTLWAINQAAARDDVCKNSLSRIDRVYLWNDDVILREEDGFSRESSCERV